MVTVKNKSEEERQECAQRCRQLRKRHASSNFTYGDTRFNDFQELLMKLNLQLNSRQEIFVDLGCGIGECLFAAALMISSSTNHQVPVFRKVTGVDLMYSKIEECRMTWQVIQAMAIEDSTLSQIVPQMKVSIIEGDFFETDLSEATVVYACATCFSMETVQYIAKACRQMPSDGKVIILDKPLDWIDRTGTNESGDRDVVETTIKDAIAIDFELLFSHPCTTSWGHGVAYVYRRR
jgi:SAM-dependent methyltransferase